MDTRPNPTDATVALSPGAQAIIATLREVNDEVRQQLADLQRTVEAVRNGFPDGDPDSHRRYHESVIEWRELRNRVVREALVKVAQAGAVAGAGWILYAIWQAIKMEITK